MFMYILTFISGGDTPLGFLVLEKKTQGEGFAGGFEVLVVYAKSYGGGSGKEIFDLVRKRES